MFLQERIETSEELDIAVGKALQWSALSDLLLNNVSIKAVYGELSRTIGEVRVATDLEKSLLDVDVVVTLDPDYTSGYEEIDYIAVIAHLLRTVSAEYRRDKPAITIDKSSYSKIDLAVVKEFGKDHYAYQSFFSRLEELKDALPEIIRKKVKRPLQDVQTIGNKREGT